MPSLSSSSAASFACLSPDLPLRVGDLPPDVALRTRSHHGICVSERKGVSGAREMLYETKEVRSLTPGEARRSWFEVRHGLIDA